VALTEKEPSSNSRINSADNGRGAGAASVVEVPDNCCKKRFHSKPLNERNGLITPVHFRLAASLDVKVLFIGTYASGLWIFTIQGVSLNTTPQPKGHVFLSPPAPRKVVPYRFPAESRSNSVYGFAPSDLPVKR